MTLPSGPSKIENQSHHKPRNDAITSEQHHPCFRPRGEICLGGLGACQR
jgi:hypothetical protein